MYKLFSCTDSYSKTATNKLVELFKKTDGQNKDHLAATNATLDDVEKLLDLNANPNATFKDEKGNKVPLISFASKTSNPRLTSLLLEYGANPNTRDHKGRSCLGLSLSSNTINFSTNDHVNPEFGDYLLESAKKNLFKREETVQALLNAGAKTKIFNRSKETPIQNLFIGDVKGVIIKNAYISDIKRVDDNKKELIPNPDMVEYPLSVFDKKETLLPDQDEKKRIIQKLVENEIKLNTKEKNGYSPLHLAVLKQDSELVKLFVNSGADVNAKSKKNLTPLHIAAYKCNKDIVDTLLDNGANPKLQDKWKRKPSDLAVLKDNLDLANYINKHEVQPRVEEKDAETVVDSNSIYAKYTPNTKERKLPEKELSLNLQQKTKQKSLTLTV